MMHSRNGSHDPEGSAKPLARHRIGQDSSRACNATWAALLQTNSTCVLFYSKQLFWQRLISELAGNAERACLRPHPIRGGRAWFAALDSQLEFGFGMFENPYDLIRLAAAIDAYQISTAYESTTRRQ